MSEKCYKLKLKQISPIHLGYKKYGVLNETKCFITGYKIWGALTNAFKMFSENNSYSEIENIFSNITCFFPELKNKILLPEYKNGEYSLDGYKESKFRSIFEHTYLSTAISPEINSAKDESLHELSVILPKSKNKKEQLYWSGYLYIDIHKNQKLKDFLKKGTELIIGGDSKYGLGKLTIENFEQNEEKNLENLVYTKFSKDMKLDYGKIEPVIEYKYSNSTTNERTGKVIYCLTPGSKITDLEKYDISEIKKGIFYI